MTEKCRSRIHVNAGRHDAQETHVSDDRKRLYRPFNADPSWYTDRWYKYRTEPLTPVIPANFARWKRMTISVLVAFVGTASVGLTRYYLNWP